MVYGRRKTGKSLIKNFTHYDKFFFDNRDSTVVDEGTLESYLRLYQLFQQDPANV
jgi:hypothetical protein